MGEIIDAIGTEAANFIGTIVLLAFSLFGLLIAALVWGLISSTTVKIEQEKWLREARGVFDAIREEDLPPIQADAFFRSVFGTEVITPAPHSEHSSDWIMETLFSLS